MLDNLLRFSFILITGVLLTSCGSYNSKRISKTNREEIRKEQIKRLNKEDSEVNTPNSLAEDIVSTAKGFEGTRYRYGGTDKRGIDCSGLIYISFLEQGINLPRTSRDMSLLGDRLFIKEISVGDLLFFETNKNRKVINHVGLVVKVTDDDIFFIHSSSSRGVIVSSLSESYWNRNFVMAKRVI